MRPIVDCTFGWAVTDRRLFGAGVEVFSVCCSTADVASLISGAVSFIMKCPAALTLAGLDFGFLWNESTSGSKDSQVFGEFG